jgi:transporter family protein
VKEWILPTSLSLLAWGLWAYLPKIATRYVDPKSAMVYQALGGVLIGLGFLIVLKFRVEFNLPGFSYNLVIGLLGFSGAFMYLVAVSKGPLTLVTPITALYPMLAIILGFVFLNEAISLKQGVGIAMSLVAIYLIST